MHSGANVVDLPKNYFVWKMVHMQAIHNNLCVRIENVDNANKQRVDV